jgi:two-component system OmpR family sensor kinase
MRTPSLRRRVVVSGVAVLTLVLVAFATFVTLTARARLHSNLDDVLAERERLVRELADTEPADDLTAALQALGVPASVADAGGTLTRSDPASPRLGPAPPGPAVPAGPIATRRFTLPDGRDAEVYASAAGVRDTLRTLVMLSLVGIVAGVLVATLLFRRVAHLTMAPLDEVVRAADRTAAGRSGERLRPDDPDSELGRMAVAYDHMLDTLESALAGAQEAEERTRRFVDDAAHQLRTPLATIRGSVEALLQEQDPRIRDRLLANLVRETARSDRLLTSLLTMARLDQGRPVTLTPTDVGAICRDELGRILSLAPHLRVDVRSQPEARGRWLADEPAVREILANLLDNARRHAIGEVTVERRVVAGPDGDQLEIRVRDDGPGVPDGAEELVFERFATLDGKGGSGLGLPIARRLAQAQGGDVVLDGEGAFVLRLPARRPDP